MKKLFLLVAIAACGGKSSTGTTTHEVVATPDAGAAPAGDPKAEALAAENDAFEAAKPVFEKYCANCHSKDGRGADDKKLFHFEMTSYPFGGHHVATMGPTISHVLGIDGAQPIMPKDHPGAVQGDDLAKVKAWVDAWQKAEDAGAHPPHDPDTDKDVDEG